MKYQRGLTEPLQWLWIWGLVELAWVVFGICGMFVVKKPSAHCHSTTPSAIVQSHRNPHLGDSSSRVESFTDATTTNWNAYRCVQRLTDGHRRLQMRRQSGTLTDAYIRLQMRRRIETRISFLPSFVDKCASWSEVQLNNENGSDSGSNLSRDRSAGRRKGS